MMTPYTRQMIDESVRGLDAIIIADHDRRRMQGGRRLNLKGENPAFIRAAKEFATQLRALND